VESTQKKNFYKYTKIFEKTRKISKNHENYTEIRKKITKNSEKSKKIVIFKKIDTF